MKFFTADLHFDHEGVLEMSGRPFSSIYEHDLRMVDNINSRVDEGDSLYVLGDVAWHGIDNYLGQIICKNVHLIWGNHDKGSFGKKFKTAQDVLEVTVSDGSASEYAWLSHYPHAYWPRSHRGSFHFYGHTHFMREGTLNALFPGRRSIDVGVDSAAKWLGDYVPFSERELFAILANRPGHDLIRFYREYQGNL